MRIHKSIQVVQAPGIQEIIPSIHYTLFNLSDAQKEIIESHKWSGTSNWKIRVTQECSECGSHISIALKDDLFLVLTVYYYGEKIITDVLPCNDIIAKDIIE